MLTFVLDEMGTPWLAGFLASSGRLEVEVLQEKREVGTDGGGKM